MKTNKFQISDIIKSQFKWLGLALIIGILVGTASAFFLTSLNWVTEYRENHLWIIAGLPIAGLVIGLLYHYYGGITSKGNNLLIEEYYENKNVVPLKMAPLVLIGTLLTHLFGGSAGREGTAVQMGGAISDQFTRIFKLDANDRKVLLILGISAGFASVFGTPWAGAIFGLEVITKGSFRLRALLASILTAFVADYTCSSWHVAHTHYKILESIPSLNFQNINYTILAGIIFGLTAWLFSQSHQFFSSLFAKIKFSPFRPFIGGLILVFVIWILGTTKYIGLGIPTILASFDSPLHSYDFLIKLILTAFTLAAGFKGGEVTPLFFIGATLGNALALFIPLPLSLLAAMGFIAVFSGASNTPFACVLMGIELFGYQATIFFAIICFVAYLFSGKKGIYSAQLLGEPKHSFLNYLHNLNTKYFK